MSVRIDISEIQTVEQKLMLRQTELLKSIKSNVQFMAWMIIGGFIVSIILLMFSGI